MTRGLTFTAVGLTVLIALVLVHPTCCAITAHLWETRVFRRENDDVEEVEVEEERVQRGFYLVFRVFEMRELNEVCVWREEYIVKD